MATLEPLYYSGTSKDTGYITNAYLGTKFTNTLSTAITITAISIYCKGSTGSYYYGWLGNNTLSVASFTRSSLTGVSSSLGWNTFTLSSPVTIEAGGTFYAGILNTSSNTTYIGRYVNSTGNTYYLASTSITSGTLAQDNDALGSTATPKITIEYESDDTGTEPEVPVVTGTLEPLYYTGESRDTGYIYAAYLGTKFTNTFDFPITVTDVSVYCKGSTSSNYYGWLGNNTLSVANFTRSAKKGVTSSLAWTTFTLSSPVTIAAGGTFYAGILNTVSSQTYIGRYVNSTGNTYYLASSSITSGTLAQNNAALGSTATPKITVTYEANYTDPIITRTVMSASGSTLNLSWLGEDGDYNAIESYIVSIYKSDGTSVFSQNVGNVTEYSYNINKGASYYFTVQAVGQYSTSAAYTSTSVYIPINTAYRYTNGAWKEVKSVNYSSNLASCELYLFTDGEWKRIV